MIFKKNKKDQSFLVDLKNELGVEKVLDQADDLRDYSDDWTEIPGHPPDAVVIAKNVEDIQRVLKIANEYKTPVVPRVANTNIGGLAIPQRGGIVLDLTKMNQILEVNEKDMYAVIEPGVTWGDIKKCLAEKHPSLRFGYSLSPPILRFWPTA
ncbi:FAD-dependent oxidoreductase [candidate division KSB1 bacterium]|nr:FAD-dependent oxidoreductase [candidate division KSB1 bacterium]